MGDFYPASLFVSYSHQDQEIVRPLIAMNEDLQQAAWVDYVHTVPGSAWDKAHKKAIKKCYRLVLLWSRNAAASIQVEREWRWAVECGTKVVPVLLDNTPLPSELSMLHAVSLREYVVSKSNRLTIGRFPPTEWMGLGTSYDTVGIALGTVFVLALAVVSGIGVKADSILINVGAWIGLLSCLLLAFGLLTHIPIEINRYRLRYRLSRIVVQSLKEWGYEHRAE